MGKLLRNRKLSYRELHEIGSFKDMRRHIGSPKKVRSAQLQGRLERLETTMNDLSRKVNGLLGKMDLVLGHLLPPKETIEETIEEEREEKAKSSGST